MPSKRIRRKDLIAGAAATGAGLAIGSQAKGRPLDVQISIPDEDGLALNGTVPITVTVQPVKNMQYVRTLIDGTIAKESPSSPSVYQWDTKLTTDGTHVIEAIAQYKTRKSTAKIVVSVNNAIVPPPPPPSGLSPIAPPQGTMTTRTGDLLIRLPSQGIPSPGIVNNIHVTEADYFACLVMQWPPAEWSTRYTVRDVILENTFIDPIDTGGTDEADLWGGQMGDYYRFVTRNAEWMGVFSGSRCNLSKFYSFQVLAQRNVGFYVEHVTCNTDIHNFNIESIGTGINNEWTYPNSVHADFYDKVAGVNGQGRAGSALNRIFDGRIRSQGSWSIYLDAGCFGYRIAMDGYLDVNKPIRLPLQMMDASRPNLINEANINWNGIPEGQRIMYHNDPIGVMVAPRLAFGLEQARVEGMMPHRQMRDWDALGKKIMATA